jgi:hypothetical protein
MKRGKYQKTGKKGRRMKDELRKGEFGRLRVERLRGEQRSVISDW